MAVERIEPGQSWEERRLLEGFLDYHRATLELKVDGVPLERLKERGVPPSSLSLHGLVRHMAEVERSWFQRRLAQDPDAGFLYCDRETNPDGYFDDVDDADPAADLATWRAQCERSREVAAARTMEEPGAFHEHMGEHVTLRWVYVHMIEEYARHNGHADLLRERIDGATGE